jgi:hypothetical protein
MIQKFKHILTWISSGYKSSPIKVAVEWILSEELEIFIHGICCMSMDRVWIEAITSWLYWVAVNLATCKVYVFLQRCFISIWFRNAPLLHIGCAWIYWVSNCWLYWLSCLLEKLALKLVTNLSNWNMLLIILSTSYIE